MEPNGNLQETGCDLPEKRRESYINPWEKARGYQLEVLHQALKENTIVFLETGTGKTLIAVLLIDAYSDFIRKPNAKFAVLLVPNRPLVEQQARHIEDHSNLRVGRICGSDGTSCSWNPTWWRNQMAKFEVFVMTPEILFNSLHHCFLKMDMIELLVFDECHHAMKEHPYAKIMRSFYHEQEPSLPKIFGLTASPLKRKVTGQEVARKIDDDIHKLERMLDSKIYTLQDRSELDDLLPNPIQEIRSYGRHQESDAVQKLYPVLERLRTKHANLLHGGGHESETSLRKGMDELRKAYETTTYCLHELGLWCVLQAAQNLLNKKGLVPRDEAYSDSSRDAFLREALLEFKAAASEGGSSGCWSEASGCDRCDIDRALITSKLLCLVDVIQDFRNKYARCIVFVERVSETYAVSSFLNHLKMLSFIQSLPLAGAQHMSQKSQQQIIEKFRSGEVNLLVATEIAEEGLDIQTCSMVIRFDGAPKTTRSFIQSRGRARQKGSVYIMLVERENEGELNDVHELYEKEKLLREFAAFRSGMPAFRDNVEESEREVYGVENTGARVTSDYSVQLLHRFCSTLPGDQFFQPKPDFTFHEGDSGIFCEVKLPFPLPTRVVGRASGTEKMAKRFAALEACKILHEMGVLNDNFLPFGEEETMDGVETSDQADTANDPMTQMELHAAATLEAFRGEWGAASSSVFLHAFVLNIVAEPKDREYADFGIFFASDLDELVKDVVTDLFLTKGRLLHLNLVSKGRVEFNVEQLKLAKEFQERLYSITLDTKKDQQGTHSSTSPVSPSWDSQRLFLNVPILQSADSIIAVDWKAVKMLLRGATEKSQIRPLVCRHAIEEGSSEALQPCDKMEIAAGFLQMANALVPVDIVVNSLVVTIHNNGLYCVESVFPDLDSESAFPNPSSEYDSYFDYYKKRYGRDILKPKQRLLKAKPLMKMHNLLVKRPEKDSGSASKRESFIELPPELCHIKALGLSIKLVNAMSIIPSFMQRLERLLLTTQFKRNLEREYTEAMNVSLQTLLAALTTAKCLESFNLERLELFGDSFLKLAVSKRVFLIHKDKHEGQLSKLRQSVICNSALHQRAVAKELTLYIQDELFSPTLWSAPGRSGRVLCHAENCSLLHPKPAPTESSSTSTQTKCSEGHRWLQKKTIADAVEGLIGAHLVDGGPEAALAFMSWAGIKVDFDDILITESSSRCLGDINDIQGKDLSRLEGILDYSFANKSLLVEAITHASFQVAFKACYQRLEFLGDAVLDYLITCHLFENFPDMPPGHLTDLRSATASNECFARVAVRFGLEEFLLRNSDHLNQQVKKFVAYIKDATDGEQVHGWDCDKPGPKVLGDLVESLAGAVFVDSKFDTDKVWAVFEPLLQPIVTPETLRLHPVRELEELCNKRKWNFKFDITKRKELKIATYNVYVKTPPLESRGEKESKKVARRLAASEMLKQLKSMGYQHPYKELTNFLISKGKLKCPPSAFEGRKSAKTVNKVECSDSKAAPIASHKRSEDICTIALDHQERVILSSVATETVSSVHEHQINDSEASSNKVGENFLHRKVTSVASSDTDPLQMLNGAAATVAQRNHVGVWGTSEVEVVAVHELSNSLADLSLSESNEEAVHLLSNSLAALNLPGPCKEGSRRQSEIPFNEEVKNMIYVASGDGQTPQCILKHPSHEPGVSGIYCEEGSSSSVRWQVAAEEEPIPTVASLSHHRGFRQHASLFGEDASSCDFGVADRGDVQSLIDVLLHHSNVPVSQFAGGGPNVYFGAAAAAAAAAATPFGESIAGSACRSVSRTHTSDRNSLLSGMSSQAKVFDENVGRPREDLHNICAKYKWATPSYEPLPDYPQGPAHSYRFGYGCKLTCSMKQGGATKDYDVECEGDIMKDKRRAMDSAASYVLEWLRSNFSPAQFTPTRY